MRMKAGVFTSAALAACLWAVAVFLTAAYYLPDAGITYTTAIDWTRLSSLVPRVGWRQLASTVGLYDVAFWVSLGLAAWAALTSEAQPRRRTVLALMSPAILLFPLNAVGALAAMADVFVYTPPDGETLAEGGLQASVYALWTMAAVVAAWRMSATARLTVPSV